MGGRNRRIPGAGEPASPANRWTLGSVRDPIPQNKVESDRKALSVVLWLLHSGIPMCTYSNTWMHKFTYRHTHTPSPPLPDAIFLPAQQLHPNLLLCQPTTAVAFAVPSQLLGSRSASCCCHKLLYLIKSLFFYLSIRTGESEAGVKTCSLRETEEQLADHLSRCSKPKEMPNSMSFPTTSCASLYVFSRFPLVLYDH